MADTLEKEPVKRKTTAKRKKTTAPKKPVTKRKVTVKKPTAPKTAPKTATRKRRPSKAQQKRQDEKIIKKAVGEKTIVDDDLIEELGQEQKSQDQLNIIQDKSAQAVILMRRIENGETLLKELKSNLHTLVSKEIPEKMIAINMNAFELGDGSQISIKDVMSGSLPKNPEKRAEAIKYLKQLKAGGLLKPSIKVQLAVGEEQEANAAIKACKRISSNKKKRDALVKAGISLEDIEALKLLASRAEISHDVHHSTLAAFGREIVGSGKELDCKKLGLYSAKIANINLAEDKRNGKN